MNARLFGLLSLVALLFGAPLAHATPPYPDPWQGLRLELSGSLGDFYLLYGVDADPSFGQLLDLRLQRGDQLLNQLAPGDAPRLAPLVATWQRYRDQLRSIAQNLQRGRLPDGNAVSMLLELNRQLLRHCDSLGPATERPTAAARLALRLQQLTTDYIAYSIGANALGGDNQAIDEQARQFASELQLLLRQAEPGGERQRRLQAIARKWRYMEPSLLGYGQRAVPSLMHRYSGSIIAELMQLGAAG
ncbi:hypothetical protein AAFN46_18935 [Pseudomonas sp. CAU 1711]|uniref:hypothetical protein n=1 Tax=Pseudomonas sp. CAU 1711 TaxID=3140356 RepID=UPI0032616580